MGEKNGPLDALREEINNKIGNGNQILSIEILLPDSIKFERIKSWLHHVKSGVITKETYDSFINSFVSSGNSLRSLYFIKYSEPFKYKGVKKKTDKCVTHIDLGASYATLEREAYKKAEIPDTILPKLQDESSLNGRDGFWKAWETTIAKNFNLPVFSTLWSYIYLKDKDFICSAYVIFAKPIEDKGNLLSVINKKIQEFLYDQTLDFFKKDIEQAAIRAAISQVMARNTSHNIGAHVMNKLIGDLSALPLFDFSDPTKHNYQSTFEKNLQQLHKEVETKLNDDKDLSSLPDAQKAKVLKHRILLEQISLFNNYVKCRMDYLADVSFGIPLMQTNKLAYAELFKDLDKVRLLLEHISGLSDFKYKIEFTRNGKKFKDDGGDQDDLLVAIPNDILGTQAFYNILENIIRNTAKHSTNKPDITVFTVNFIDEITIKAKNENGIEKEVNVVKYCKCKENLCKCTKPTKTEVQNALNEFITVEVYDNIPINASEKYTLKNEKDENGKTEKGIYYDDLNNGEAYISASPHEIGKIDWLVYSQNKKLNDDILKDNKLRSGSLGLVEMDASAAYLRKRPVEFINHRSYEIHYDESWSRNSERNRDKEHELRGTNCRHFLKAFKKKEISADFTTEENGKSTTITKTGNALGYRFFLHRPAVVLVVTDSVPDNKDELQKQGIWVKTKIKFEEDLKKGKVYNHEFVLHTGLSSTAVEVEIDVEENGETKKQKTNVPILEHYKTSLPIRVLKETEGTITIENLLKKTGKEIEECCWRMWGNKLLDDKILDIGNGYNDEAYKDKTVQAVFLDHLYGENGSYDGAVRWKEYTDKGTYHLEALSSYAQARMPDYNKITKDYTENGSYTKFQYYVGKINSNIITKLKIGEAVLSKVIVIDERIQEAAKNRHYMKVPFKDLYDRMNVVIPEKGEINLSDNTYSKELITKIKEYLGLSLDDDETSQSIQCVLKDSKNTDFILMHYSILERMFDKKEINKKIEEIIAKGINVVITSGRGIPDNLTPKARFVNLSSIITTFTDIRSKYAISYLLNSSRKSNKI